MKVIWSAMRTPEKTDVPALLRRLTWAVVVLVALAICLAVWAWHLNNQNAERATENKQAVVQIQAERRRNTLEACRSTNEEHQAIYDFIAGSIPKERRDEPRVMLYLQRVRKNFPVRDCRRLVAERVQPTDS